MKTKTLKYIFVLLLTGISVKGLAQLNPFQSMYYQDRYLLNPALAGINKGLNVNLDYLQQWSSFPGTPKTASLTGDFSAADRVGLGLNINDDQSGIIRSTRAMASYAYHVPLSEQGQHLNFGLSLGIDDSRVDYSKVNGDLSDEQIAVYNQLKPYIDGNVGVAYTSDRLLLSGALPSLKSTLFKASDTRFDADMLLFVGAAAYKFTIPSDYIDMELEPMAVFRAVKGYTSIMDAGFNLAMKNYGLNIQVMYHSNQNTSVGFGVNLQPVQLTFNYNVETGALSSYTNGSFELGLRLHMPGK